MVKKFNRRSGFDPWVRKIPWGREWQFITILLPGKSHGQRNPAGYNPCHSVVQSCLTLCDPIDCSMPGFPVLHCLLALAQTHVHWVGAAIQPSCPLSSLSPPALNLSQHLGLFQWVGSSHQVAKVLEQQQQMDTNRSENTICVDYELICVPIFSSSVCWESLETMTSQ